MSLWLTLLPGLAPLLASDTDTIRLLLLLAGPLAGGGFAWLTFLRYRNTNQTNQFERETAVTAQPVQGSDTLVDRLRATRRPHTTGRNEQDFRARVTRLR
jgi:hypothetical protein